MRFRSLGPLNATYLTSMFIHDNAFEYFNMGYATAVIRYTILTVVAIIMIYPILWLIGAAFKTNNEIFTTITFILKKIDFTPYIEDWKTRTKYTFTPFFLNTFSFVVPKILFCLVSSTLVAYGFARFVFPCR